MLNICKWAAVQLADFGLSRVLDTNGTHVSTQTYGTLAYQPAELLRDGKLTKAVDVYSFGMIMWELYSGRRLFENNITGQVAPWTWHHVFHCIMLMSDGDGDGWSSSPWGTPFCTCFCIASGTSVGLLPLCNMPLATYKIVSAYWLLRSVLQCMTIPFLGGAVIWVPS